VLSAGDLVALDIEKPAVGGEMIGRVDGRVVLVSGAIPGERVTARVGRVSKRVAYASVASIEVASPDRRAVDADPLCGGCLYAHIAYSRQREIKGAVIADAFARLGGIALADRVAVTASPEDGYRMRARLHVRGPRVGFFREGSHEICGVRGTRQLLPATADLIDRLAAGLASLRVSEVREIELGENLDASERVVHVSTSGGDAARLATLARTDGLTGLTSSAAGASHAVVLGGSPYLVDRLTLGGRDLTVRRHVLSFFQGNRFLFGALVERVIAAVPEGGSVLELYAGGGIFAVATALVRGGRVTAVEGDRTAAADLAVNAEQAGGAVSPVHQPVETYRQAGAFDVVIVDPPRTGLSKEAVQGVIRHGAPCVVYVSCDVGTLARDARRLLDAGYRLGRVEAFDLFPNTPHVETLALFER
jgi:23S rRNA (uracil1939-C5)-methyltransferase